MISPLKSRWIRLFILYVWRHIYQLNLYTTRASIHVDILMLNHTFIVLRFLWTSCWKRAIYGIIWNGCYCMSDFPILHCLCLQGGETLRWDRNAVTAGDVSGENLGNTSYYDIHPLTPLTTSTTYIHVCLVLSIIKRQIHRDKLYQQ